MTQKDLIQKLKLELGKDFNENASFLVTQPLFKDMTVGLKRDELVNGIYVTLLDKNQAPMLDGNAFYFKVTDPEQYCAKLYSTQWKKYMFPLSKIGDWSTVVLFSKPKAEKQTVKEYEDWVVAKMQAQDEREAIEEFALKIEIVEEFPIQKIHTQTVYTKNDTKFVFGKNPKSNVVTFSIQFEELEITEQQFSDLVDLIIEARKDLLK